MEPWGGPTFARIVGCHKGRRAGCVDAVAGSLQVECVCYPPALIGQPAARHHLQHTQVQLTTCNKPDRMPLLAPARSFCSTGQRHVADGNILAA